MKIVTNSTETAERLLGGHCKPHWSRSRAIELQEDRLNEALFGSADVWRSDSTAFGQGRAEYWQQVMIVEAAPRSQYDALVELGRSGVEIPDGLICLAGQGDGFHGFKGRSWASPPGNVYLSAHLAPNRKIVDFGIGFLMLAAVSVIEALDAADGLRQRAMIKWVNDILIEGAKVCGVLANCSSQGERVTGAVLGIGLNVLATPVVEPTPYVPTVASLSDFCERPHDTLLPDTIRNLIDALGRNYQVLLEHGCRPLFEKYYARSLVLGREAAIHEDTPEGDGKILARGKVTGMSPQLGLVIEGRDKPVSSGRLVLKS